MDIFDKLVLLGAPLIRTKTELKNFNKEEALAEAFCLAWDNPRIFNVLPFTLLKNLEDIDFHKLASLLNPQAYALMGLTLDILKELKYPTPLLELKPLNPALILFAKLYGSRSKERILKNNSPLAHKWGIVAEISLEVEKQKILKWQ